MRSWFNSSGEGSRRNERGDRGRERGDRSRRNEDFTQVASQEYRYTGISASELARRELEPQERREQRNLRREFRAERNALDAEHAQLRQGIENDFSPKIEALKREFDKENEDAAQQNNSERRNLEDFFRQHQTPRNEQREMRHELEERIRRATEARESDQQQRMNALLEKPRFYRANLEFGIQAAITKQERDHQKRMNELVARQTERRQARVNQYESVVATASMGYVQDSESLSLPSDSER
jgi:hypothetical protein